MRFRYRHNDKDQIVEVADNLNDYTVADLVAALENLTGTNSSNDDEKRVVKGVRVDGCWHGPQTPLSSANLWEGSQVEVLTASGSQQRVQGKASTLSYQPLVPKQSADASKHSDGIGKPEDNTGTRQPVLAGRSELMERALEMGDNTGTRQPVLAGRSELMERALEMGDNTGTRQPVLAVVGGLHSGTGFSPSPQKRSLVIGRADECDIVLNDPAVSRRHARLEAQPGQRPAIRDLGSRNGIALSGRGIKGPTHVPAGDTVRMGATRLAWRSVVADVPAAVSAGLGVIAGRVPFNRPPRRRPAMAPASIRVPGEPPPQPSTEPLSWAGIALPVVAGLVLAVIWSPFMAIFAVLGPVITIGTWLERRRRATKTHRKACADVAKKVTRLAAALPVIWAAERHRLITLIPDPAEIVRRACGPSVRCWERRLNDPDAMKLGIGTADIAFVPPLEISGNKTGANISAAADALTAIGHMGPLRDVPVAVSLFPGEIVGIVGPSTVTRSVARCLVLQATVLHGPADLAVVGLTPGTGDAWNWLRWLPHCADINGGQLCLVATNTEAMTAVAESVSAEAASSRAQLVVVEGSEAITGRAAPGRRLLTLKNTAGLVLASDVHDLPAACTTIVEVTHSVGGIRLIDPRSSVVLAPVIAWGVSRDTAGNAAARIARLDDPELATASANLPPSVSLVDLLGGEITAEVVKRRWKESRDKYQLATPIGVDSSGPVVVDFVADGPHMLVGGTTGSGKSELLRTLVAGLAASAAADQVAFVLVDYKGGAAFDRCSELPHVAGMVTDLDDRLAERALVCLEAELRYREERLRESGSEDLKAFWAWQRRQQHQQSLDLPGSNAGSVTGATASANASPTYGSAPSSTASTNTKPNHGSAPSSTASANASPIHDSAATDAVRATTTDVNTATALTSAGQDPLPRLVVIVDEFATLAADLPEFLHSLVGVAQRGRSLGVHMVLATQRPAGVVTDDIRANTSCRIALRVTDRHDSNDVIGSPEAATLPRRLPGRALARFGPGELTAFQTALVTGTTPPRGAGLRLSMVDAQSSALNTKSSSEASRVDALVAARASESHPTTNPDADTSTDASRIAAATTARASKDHPTTNPDADTSTDASRVTALVATRASKDHPTTNPDAEASSSDAATTCEASDSEAGARNGSGSDVVTSDTSANEGSGCARNDLDLLVQTVREAHRHQSGRPARSIWLPPLPDEVSPETLTARANTTGRAAWLVDDPGSQRQYVHGWHPCDGHLVVIGGPASGTSTTLAAVAVDICRTFAPSELHCYGIDLDSGLLQSIDGLPHVGSVVSRSDTERRVRLLRFLDNEITKRRASGSAHTDNAAAWPQIVMLVDDLAGLARAHDPVRDTLPHQHLARIWSDGASVGVRVAVSIRRAADLAPDLAANAGVVLVHNTSDVGDGLRFGLRTDTSSFIPGRAIRASDGLEVQVCRPVGGDFASTVAAVADCWPQSATNTTTNSDPSNATSTSKTFNATATSEPTISQRPTTIGVLPAVVMADALPTGATHETQRIDLRFAMSDLTLEATGFSLHDGEHVVVLGPPRTGRTAALAAIGMAARRAGATVLVVTDRPASDLALRLDTDAIPPETLTDYLPNDAPNRGVVHNDAVHSEITHSNAAHNDTAHRGVVHSNATNTDLDNQNAISAEAGGSYENKSRFRQTNTAQAQDNQQNAAPRRMLLVDDADRIRDSEDNVLAQLLANRDSRTHIVAALSADRLRQSYGHWTSELRSCRTGVLFRPGPLDGDLLGVALPSRLQLPPRPGCGLIVANGIAEAGQVALVAATA